MTNISFLEKLNLNTNKITNDEIKVITNNSLKWLLNTGVSDYLFIVAGFREIEFIF